jgi:hypothetical protein
MSDQTRIDQFMRVLGQVTAQGTFRVDIGTRVVEGNLDEVLDAACANLIIYGRTKFEILETKLPEAPKQ